MQRSRVHADANWNAAVTRFAGDEFDFGGLSQVPRIESKTVHACFERREGHLDVEVNVSDDGHRRARHDLGESFGRSLIIARATNDVGAVSGERVNLLERSFDVSGLRRRHRLHRNWCVAPDLH